jgi:DNA-binding MarR family transcriptional regulator
MEVQTIEERALDCLMGIMEFYHKTLFMAERKEITGIQEAKLRLLIWLCTEPMLSMSTLGRLLYTSKSHITTLVDALINEGLVKRHYDPNDRRVINISITQEGIEKLEMAKFQIRSHIQKVISNLHENDLKVLHASGEKFIEIISKVS